MPPTTAGHAVGSVVIPTRASVTLCWTQRALNVGLVRRRRRCRCRRGGKTGADVVFAQLVSDVA
ncbi:MAG: hypothetical protein ACI8TF_002431 [Paracoccaceae bacterium]|jgi:hypothetical protein